MADPEPASTVLVVREAAGGFEVLMLRRSRRSGFVAGAYVFPGGRVEPDDQAAEILCSGRSDAEASALLGMASGGLAYWVAAVRECFEEAGLLLGRRDGADLRFEDPATVERFARLRRDLNGGRRRFAEVCTDEKIELAVGEVHYFAHWITPAGAPRRYDTRFFVAPAPPGQTALHDAAETVEAIWTTPEAALRRHREGEIELLFPTVRTLQAISRFTSAAELLAAAEAASGDVASVEPRVVVEANGARILLPGDEGYATAEAPVSSADAETVSRAVRSLSRAANAKPPSES